VIQKFRELDRREKQNIFKLEIDEIMADGIMEGDRQLSVLGILNFFLSRFFFFTIPVKGERFTNLFFRFLDFSDKSAEML
jgi:hypothetical protein